MLNRLGRHRHSLAARLLWLFVAMGVLVAGVVGGLGAYSVREHFHQHVLPHLTQYLAYVHEDIGDPPNLERAASVARRLKTDMAIVMPASMWTSWGKPFDRQHVDIRKEVSHGGFRYAIGSLDERRWLIVKFPHYELVTSIPERRERFDVRQVWPVVAILLLMVIFYYAARRLISPIQTIRAGVHRFGQGDFSQRLSVRRKDELGVLAESINTMADEIERMLEAKRQLLLAISHELRTPLTRAKVAAAMVEQEAQRRDVERELNEMDQLVGELLETERLHGRHAVLATGAIELTSWLRETIAAIEPEGELEIDMPAQAVVVTADPVRLRMLVRNLLDNARHHNARSERPRRVSLAIAASEASIAVRDYGAGIDPKHLPHLTEPFYRAEVSRRRESGGYGLGLYLCRLIAQAHGGRLEINSVVGEGTEVKVYLPYEVV